MRPVKLTLSGLHSYREPVTVDFTALGRYGLFGIFGPIGSGKSTILDGITLALYGLVDRVVTRSRRGLINLGSEHCEVRFSFHVGSPGAAQDPALQDLYEVQRSYQERDGVAHRVASRLLQHIENQPTVVLADKERDVNQAVERLVGLGAEDFMRAVVLPQGRFQQLLHLKGSERRRMLQRIFRLHAYGEGLRRQIQLRLSESGEELAKANGELAGLGDASELALTAARARSEAASQALAGAQATHAGLAKKHVQAQEERLQQAKLLEAQEALEAHRAEAKAQEQAQQKLAQAERIGPLLVPCRRWLAELAAASQANATLNAAAAAGSQAEATWRAAAERHQRAKLGSQTRAPAARAESAKLEQALQAARERQELERRLEAARESQAQAESSLARLQEQQSTLEAAVASARAECRSRKRALRRARVPVDERTAVHRAAKAAESLSHAQRAVERARKRADASAVELHEAGAAHTRATNGHQVLVAQVEAGRALVASLRNEPGWLAPSALRELEEALSAQRSEEVRRSERDRELQAADAADLAAAQALETARAAAAEAEAEAEAAREVLKGAEQAVVVAENELRQRQRRAAVNEVARSLAPGKPCSVCGSPHHPAPAVDPYERPADQAEARPEQAALEAHLEGRRQARVRHESALAAHAGATAALEAAVAGHQAANQTARAARARRSELSQSDPSGLHQQLRAHQALEGKLAELERNLRDAELAAERAHAPVAAASARLEQLTAEADRAQAELSSALAEEEAGWSEFHAVRGTLTLFDVTNAVAALHARDREAHRLQLALEADEAALAEHQDGLATLREQLQATRSALAAASSTVVALEDRLGAEVEPQTPAASVEQLTVARAALEAELTQLARELSAAEQAVALATEAHQHAQQAVAGAKAEARAAERARATAESELRDAAAQLDQPVPQAPEALALFVERLEASALPESELASLQRSVAAWREQDIALVARVGMLREAAPTVAPSQEAFALLEADLQDAALALQESRETAIRAQTVLSELEARAPRYQALQTHVQTQETHSRRLTTLSSVMRGDRFVEYVATDHLSELASRASTHLASLTGDRYSLQIDEEVAFQIRDAHGGGCLRPVHTLSGGESFLTALSLALALSSQVQARSDRQLGFFFLDEGFGTLDPEALDRVMSAIEGLGGPERIIGLISHVPAIRERVPRYLWVNRADAQGSTVELRDN